MAEKFKRESIIDRKQSSFATKIEGITILLGVWLVNSTSQSIKAVEKISLSKPLSEGCVILVNATKVGLNDLFYAKSSDLSKYRIYTNKIDRKHVDFLLCDPKTVQSIAGLELDDKSHQRSDRQARDEFVEPAFQAARLPLLRIPVKHSYSTGELQTLLKPHLSTSMQTESSVPIATVEAGPCCPKCGSNMVLRTSKSGANQGEKFRGCPRFPQCRGMLNYR